jgi:large subunit ribosomal protein L21
MKYAVIQTGGKQYRVTQGQTLELEKLPGKPKTTIKFDQVLLLVDNKKILVGQPYLKGTVVNAKILEQKKGEKIRVAKFRAKSRYRRVQGHRQVLTKVQIEKITSGSKKT